VGGSAVADATWLSLLDHAFDRAIRGSMDPREPTTVLYSGGIDSSLVAHAARRVAPIRLLSIGTADSADLRAAEEGAALLDLPLRVKVVGRTEISAALQGHDLRREAEPMRSVLVALALALQACETRRVLVGQGADELFGGYAHFRSLDSASADRRRIQDWERLRTVDWPATLTISVRLGRDLRAPLLDPGFAKVALTLPIPPVSDSAVTKRSLREWAAHRGVPSALVARPKRAIQYGSGIARLVRGAAPP
jgi:asparagine synthase (glutamine-hydrolysing)